MRKIHNYILGAATVLEIYPQTNYSQLLRAGTDAEKIAGDWRAVGKDFRVAVSKILGPGKLAQTHKIEVIRSKKK